MGVGNDRTGKVKEQRRRFLTAGHPNPNCISSPSNCRSRGYSQADQLSWPHLLPSLYFPESLFPGPDRQQECLDPSSDRADAGSMVALTQPQPYSWRASGKQETYLHRHFALDREKLSSSSIVVQEMTMNKWLPVTPYFIPGLPPCEQAVS